MQCEIKDEVKPIPEPLVPIINPLIEQKPKSAYDFPHVPLQMTYIINFDLL